MRAAHSVEGEFISGRPHLQSEAVIKGGCFFEIWCDQAEMVK
jgi:hypothetical protein